MDDFTPNPLARRGTIPAASYANAEVLQDELHRVFTPSWLCVGFTTDLQNHNDFITYQIATRSIVVQNFKGELKAFRNVCSHRFSRLQTEACGNRSLTCPYHGWRYDGDGRPVGIPQNETAFELTDADKAALALESYALEVVGHFVFVRMSATGPNLREFLGEAYNHLAHVSAICSDLIEKTTLEVAANWKIGVENGVEAYHFPLVHKDSFSNVLEASSITMNTYGPHCTHEGHLTEKSQHWWSTVIKRAKLQPSTYYSDYISFLIFPNIVTTFTAAAFFTLQILTPTGSETFKITSSGWLATGSDDAIRQGVKTSLKAFSAQVRSEDKIISETVQLGIIDPSINEAEILGKVDNRISHFQKNYSRLMEVEHD